MAKRAQKEFVGKEFNRPSDSFGGGKSHAKSKRPLDSKLPLHLVLRSDNAKGDISFRHPRHFDKVNSKVRRVASKYGVKIHDYANVGNHLHILLQAPGRTIWNRFIRELTSKIMAIVTERSGRAQRHRRFWTHRPFTRVVRGWGRALLAIKNYIAFNRLEGAGKISRWTPPRKKREGSRPRGPSS